MGMEYGPAMRPGFAPLGDIRKVFLTSGQKDLVLFHDKIVVPALLLYTDFTSPVRANYNFQDLFNRVSVASGLYPEKEIFFMMIKRPDNDNWVQLPFIIEDLGKLPEDIKREIVELQHMPELTNAIRLVMGMKEAIYYAFTGHPMDTSLIYDFYRLYNTR
jgi:hypothetical protein